MRKVRAMPLQERIRIFKAVSRQLEQRELTPELPRAASARRQGAPLSIVVAERMALAVAPPALVWSALTKHDSTYRIK
jgi:hypothetical protein